MKQTTNNCDYCNKEYIPKRRWVQRFCSNKCRASFHRIKNKTPTTLIQKNEELITNGNLPINKKVKVEEVSLAGFTNAALGAGAVALFQNLFRSEANKPATKTDLLKLVTQAKRFHKVKNLQPNIMGEYPYFDLEKGEVVYLKMKFGS